MTVLFDQLGPWSEGVEYTKLAVDASRQANEIGSLALFLHNLGILYHSLGNFIQAQSLIEESLQIKQQCADRAGIVGSLHELGRLAQNNNRYEEAKPKNTIGKPWS